MLKILEEEVAKEKAKKKKKPSLELRKEKRLSYYSGWHKDDKPVTQETREEKHKMVSEPFKSKEEWNEYQEKVFLCRKVILGKITKEEAKKIADERGWELERINR